MNKELEGIVVFAILMQNNGGIMDKAPSYILEKFKYRDLGVGLLDPNNKRIFEEWKTKWIKEVQK